MLHLEKFQYCQQKIKLIQIKINKTKNERRRIQFLHMMCNSSHQIKFKSSQDRVMI